MKLDTYTEKTVHNQNIFIVASDMQVVVRVRRETKVILILFAS